MIIGPRNLFGYEEHKPDPFYRVSRKVFLGSVISSPLFPAALPFSLSVPYDSCQLSRLGSLFAHHYACLVLHSVVSGGRENGIQGVGGMG